MEERPSVKSTVNRIKIANWVMTTIGIVASLLSIGCLEYIMFVYNRVPELSPPVQVECKVDFFESPPPSNRVMVDEVKSYPDSFRK